MGYLRKRSVPSGLLWGTSVSLLTVSAGCVLISFLIHKEIIQENSLGYGVMILLMASAYTGALFAYRRVKERQLVVSIGCGLCYLALLMIMTALFFEGKYTGVGATALVVLCGAMLAAIPRKEGGRGGTRRKIKISTR